MLFVVSKELHAAHLDIFALEHAEHFSGVEQACTRALQVKQKQPSTGGGAACRLRFKPPRTSCRHWQLRLNIFHLTALADDSCTAAEAVAEADLEPPSKPCMFAVEAVDEADLEPPLKPPLLKP